MLSSINASLLPAGIQTGSVVANRYRIEEVIGRGGMGVVVAARHLELDERVAVKFMSSETLSDPEAVTRFDREVRAAARLRSEYVARVFDAGKLTDGGRYMVLEYLEGEDLSVRLHRDGPLDLDQAIRFMLQACSAVFEAHLLGIVHRDLKPANLRVVTRGDGSEIVKVLDFGVMKRMSCDQNDTLGAHTQPGTVIGTPFYTSPEQLRGKADVDVRSDVWSLGATLFELLTAQPPFGGKTYPQVIANVLEAAPLPLRTLRADLAPSIEDVVLRCLEKEPAARYGSVVELASALAQTVDLDSELSGLLERLVRRHRPPAGTAGHLGSPRSEPRHEEPTPEFAVVASRRSTPGRHGRSAEIQLDPGSKSPKPRYWLPVASSLVSAVTVVALGLPWLPRFDAPPFRQTGASPAGSLASLPLASLPLASLDSPAPSLSNSRAVVPPPAALDSPAVSLPQQRLTTSAPSAVKRSITSSAQTIAQSTATRQPPARRQASPSESTLPTRISVPNINTPSPPASSSAPRRNPLLVQPIR